jgi:Cof subfamily protein (haloacid dehalogenase superfamily)
MGTSSLKNARVIQGTAKHLAVESHMNHGLDSRIGPVRGPISRTLFVSDLDGTLLPSTKEISATQTATLNLLIEGGLQFTVATARSVQAVIFLLKDVDLRHPAITLGGSLVTLPRLRKHVLARALSQRTAEELLSRLFHRGILPFVAAIDEQRDWAFYSHSTSAAAQWYVDEKKAYSDPRLCWYEHPKDIQDKDILSITVFLEQKELEEFTGDVTQVDGCRLSAMPMRHFPGWYEVTVSHPAADKGQALGDLCRLWKDTWDRVVVFGDDLNDLPMFEAADFAVAVRNAVPDVLAKADQVIPSNESGSVIEYLAQYPFD